MDKAQLKSLEVLLYSEGWKTLTKLMEEQIEEKTEELCNVKNDTMEIVNRLRAERAARKELIELPALTLEQFKTDGEDV